MNTGRDRGMIHKAMAAFLPPTGVVPTAMAAVLPPV